MPFNPKTSKCLACGADPKTPIKDDTAWGAQRSPEWKGINVEADGLSINPTFANGWHSVDMYYCSECGTVRAET